MSDPNEGIWLTYEGILSEVEDEYKAKFDATETVKQWAVARRMFIAGKRSQQATAQRMYQEGREHVIQELIEKAKAEFLDAQKRREEMSGTSLSLRVDRAKATYEWLKSQLEEENDPTR